MSWKYAYEWSFLWGIHHMFKCWSTEEREFHNIMYSTSIYIKCDGHTKVWWSVPKSDGFVLIRMSKSNGNRITTFVPSCHDGVMEKVKLAIQSQQDGSISLYGRSIHDTFWQSERKRDKRCFSGEFFFIWSGMQKNANKRRRISHIIVNKNWW